MAVRFGVFTFDAARRQLLRGREAVHLSPKAFQLLSALLEACPRALSKEELMDLLWPESLVTEATLSSLASELRGTLGDDARRPRHLRTVHGFGYAFAGVGPAAAAAEEPGDAAVHRLLLGSREIELLEGENVVGRERAARVWIADASISRRHARFVVSGEAAALEDLGSKNGTYRGAERLHGTAVPLEDGDELRFGSVTVTYRNLLLGGSTVTKVDSRIR